MIPMMEKGWPKPAWRNPSGQAPWIKLTKQVCLRGSSLAVLHPMSRTKDRDQARRSPKRRRRKKAMPMTSDISSQNKTLMEIYK
jgi:hypothetical protein